VTRKKRRTFTPQQKAEAVKICLKSGKTIAEVARDLDLTENSLRNWVSQAKIDDRGSSDDGPLVSDEREELKRLRRDNRQLQMERDFLKKAAAFFAKESS
jgi:transposase